MTSPVVVTKALLDATAVTSYPLCGRWSRLGAVAAVTRRLYRRLTCLS